MERFDSNQLAIFFGIYSPWSINSVAIDEENKTLTLDLTTESRQKYFSILKSATKDENMTLHEWQHASFGMYKTIIRAPAQELQKKASCELDLEIQALPHFMGSPRRSYSNFVRQAIAITRAKGVDDKYLPECFNISEEIIKVIIHDIDRAPIHNKLIFLPTEVSPIWKDILLDKIHLKTNVLPLKFLLSKLKLASAKPDNSNHIINYCIELRKFFLENHRVMEQELNQLCGFTQKESKKVLRSVETKNKSMILPAINNPLWLDILSGKLNLNSQSTPLRLLISRQRNAFINSKNNTEKINAIATLRSYFKKNYRQLKPELLLINRALEIRNKNTSALPDPSHAVWQKILNDNQFLQSDHMAYKLLLSKLRIQIVKNNNPVHSIEAAKHIRRFISQNQKNMRKELTVILKQANTL